MTEGGINPVKEESSLEIALQSCGISLVPGGRYRRRRMHDCIGGQRYGGISTPAKILSILIFTGPSGKEFGYEDRWLDDTTFLCSGEGQRGDMQVSRGNLAIRDHKDSGKELHLFKIEGKGYVHYEGQVECVAHEWRIAPDVDRRNRRALAFHLKRID